MNSPGAHYLADILLRKLAMIRISEMTEVILNNLIEQQVAGILVILPNEQDWQEQTRKEDYFKL